MNLDDLDIAYIAHGAFSVLRDLPEKEHTAVLDSFSGELGFIAAVLQYKESLQSAVENIELYDGVFVYDIAEPFGNIVATWLVGSGICPCADAVAEDLIKEASK